jgi:hypothetical protein
LLNPSAFIPSRLISDDIFVAFKTTHFIKNATTASKGKMTDLKLDMSKAYDRTERGYLRVGMQKMSFEKKHFNFSKFFCVRIYLVVSEGSNAIIASGINL